MERRRCKTGSCPWYRSISQAKGQGIQITTMGQLPVVCKCSTLWRADQYQLLFYCMEIQRGYSMMPDSRKFKEKAGGYDDERGG